MRANQKGVFVIRKVGSETYWNHHTKDVVGLQISTQESGDVTMLDLRGRSTIDGGESELLSNQLQKLVANGVRKLLRGGPFFLYRFGLGLRPLPLR
jgi:hypothetical protein